MDENKENGELLEKTTEVENENTAVSEQIETEPEQIADVETEETTEEEETKVSEYEQPEEKEAPKPSKKTVGVMIAIILVLVAIIAVFVVMILDKQKKPASNPSQSAGTSISTDTTDPAKQNTEKQDTQSGTEASTGSTDTLVNYNVTVTLGQYKEIEVDYPEIVVTEDEIEKELGALSEEFAKEVEVTDRPVAMGDTAVIDYVGTRDGVAFDGGTGSKDLVIGSGAFIPGFEDSVIGHSTGETFAFDITFPENYQNAELAGVGVVFTVTINAIRTTVYPEVDDQFIADNTDYESVAAYKDYVRDYLTQNKISAADSQVEYEISQKAIANATFGGDIEQAIETLTNSYIDYYNQMANAYYGIDAPTLFYYMYGVNEEQFRGLMASEADYGVKWQNLLLEVAKVENITVSDEEFEEGFKSMFFDYYGYTSKEEVYAASSQEEADKLVRDNLIAEKAEKFLYDSAKINK